MILSALQNNSLRAFPAIPARFFPTRMEFPRTREQVWGWGAAADGVVCLLSIAEIARSTVNGTRATRNFRSDASSVPFGNIFIINYINLYLHTVNRTAARNEPWALPPRALPLPATRTANKWFPDLLRTTSVAWSRLARWTAVNRLMVRGLPTRWTNELSTRGVFLRDKSTYMHRWVVTEGRQGQNGTRYSSSSS